MSFKSVQEKDVIDAGVPETIQASRCSGGIQVKGAGPPRGAVLDLRSDSQEKSCGVGLHGFESHPPHHPVEPTKNSCLPGKACPCNPKLQVRDFS